MVYSPVIYNGEIAKPKVNGIKDNVKWIEGKAMPDSIVIAKAAGQTYTADVNKDGEFLIRMKSVIPAGKKVKVHAEFLNKAGSVKSVVVKPRKPTAKKITLKSKFVTGKASPKSKVTIAIAGKTLKVKANAKGVYKAKLSKALCKKLKAGMKVKISSKINKQTSPCKNIKIKK